MIKISPSILAAKDRIESVKKLNNTNADYLHIDTMDGLFVPNTQMPVDEILELERISKLPLDVHLMVEDPESYINHLENKNIEWAIVGNTSEETKMEDGTLTIAADEKGEIFARAKDFEEADIEKLAKAPVEYLKFKFGVIGEPFQCTGVVLLFKISISQIVECQAIFLIGLVGS